MEEAIAENASNEGEPNNWGRPLGSKKLKVRLSDVIPPELASPRGRGRPKLSSATRTEKDGLGGGQNGDSAPKPRGRGRPKGSDTNVTDLSPKKRGRPRKALSQSTGEKPPDLSNGGTEKRKRGRPKGSDSPASGEESASGPATPRKRGRPRGSPNKKPKLEDGAAETDDVLNSPRPGRGRRPDAAPPPPQESSNGAAEMPRRGRGRPRNPLPSPGEPRKPKVWKPLGRPRKYPRVDPPEVRPAPRRGLGRPRKSESKKGAHLRKSAPAAQKPDGPPRKRGRPKKTEDGSPQKRRGRPKAKSAAPTADTLIGQDAAGLDERSRSGQNALLQESQFRT